MHLLRSFICAAFIVACSPQGDERPEPVPASMKTAMRAGDSVLTRALADSGLEIGYHWVDTTGTRGAYTDPATGARLTLDSVPALRLIDIRDVVVGEVRGPRGSGAIVMVRPSFAAAQRFLSETSARRGQRIAVVVNGRVVETARIETPWGGRVPVVTGTRRSLADSLAARMKALVAE